MVKRIVLTGLVLAVFATSAWAGGVRGTVLAVRKNEVRVVTSAEPEAWVKKGGALKVLGSRGTSTEVEADAVSINSAKTLSLKTGDAVSFEKIRQASGGC